MQSTSFLEHPAEDALERYVLHQSSESEVETVETHVLACESCVTRLEQVELHIAATKLALQQLHLEKVAKAHNRQEARRSSWLSVPKLSLAGGLAMMAVALSVLPGLHREMKPAVNVQLTAYRGVESRILPKDRTLHLTLNASGLTGNLVNVTLVDGNGVETWKTAAGIKDGLVTVDVPQIHTAGTYFFRLYQPGQDSDQLREFSVIIE